MTISQLNKGTHDLTIVLVLEADHNGTSNSWMVHQTLLYFERVDVLSTC
jgi:hypothetical protein